MRRKKQPRNTASVAQESWPRRHKAEWRPRRARCTLGKPTVGLARRRRNLQLQSGLKKRTCCSIVPASIRLSATSRTSPGNSIRRWFPVGFPCGRWPRSDLTRVSPTTRGIGEHLDRSDFDDCQAVGCGGAVGPSFTKPPVPTNLRSSFRPIERFDRATHQRAWYVPRSFYLATFAE